MLFSTFHNSHFRKVNFTSSTKEISLHNSLSPPSINVLEFKKDAYPNQNRSEKKYMARLKTYVCCIKANLKICHKC
jgi:hypothetical protein